MKNPRNNINNNAFELKFILFTGSSGGHIKPAIVLHDKLINSYIVAIKSSVSYSLLSNKTNVFLISPLSLKKIRLSAFIDLIKLLVLVNKYKPNRIICFGGYLNLIGIFCFFITYAKITFFEPNFIPGKATFYLQKFASRIFTIFPQTKIFLKPKKVTLTKIPILTRKFIKEKMLQNFNFNFHQKILLILGGSQGCRFINESICEILNKLDFVQIIHITGEKEFEETSKKYFKHPGKHILLPFFDNMPMLYSITDVAISRAGAGTLSEISYFKIPSIIIPYPEASGHQEFNALFFNKIGACNLLYQKDSNPQKILDSLNNIIFNDFWKIKENLAKINIADDGDDLLNRIKG